MSNAAIERMIADRVDATIVAERTAAAAKAVEVARAATSAETTRSAATVGGAGGSNNARPTAGAGGPNVAVLTVDAITMNAIPEVRGCSYTEFMKCEPTKFKGTEGSVGLTYWLERSKLVFLISKCAENDKVKYATSTLLDEALSWWNSVAQPIGIENAYKIPWGSGHNNLQPPISRTTIVPTTEKLLERYVWGLPQPIQGNVTSFDPDTIDEAMRMARMLMDHVVRAGTVLENARCYATAATAPAGGRGYPLVALLWVNANALNTSIGFDNPVRGMNLTDVNLSIMGEPLSPDRLFDFPMDELHPAFNFFAPGPLPGYAGNPNNNNGWLEADDYLLGELEAMADEQMVVPAVKEIAEQMVVPAIEEVVEPMVEAEEQMVASVMDMEEDLIALFGENDDFEDDDSKDEEEV
ncbi:hypothetical protein Tco_0646950 [Tanacetum coccineum]